MKKNLTLLLSLILLFTACNKDDESTGPIIKNFEFIVSSNYITNNETRVDRHWVLVYNAENELLIKQELQNGMTYNFDSVDLPATGLTLQTITYRDYAEDYVYADDDYYIYNYTNVSPDSWIFGSEPAEVLEPIGTISLNMNDIDLYNYYVWDLKSSYSYGYSVNEGIYEMDQYFNPDDVWLMLLNQDEAPYYKFFEDVALNGSISVSSSELDQMNDYVDISFPANEYMYVYVESEDDMATDFWDYYMVYYNSWDDGMTSIRTYYPGNLFSGYYSYLRASNSNKTEYMLNSRGPVPGTFESLDATVSLTNNSVSNFQASLNSNADICLHRWYYSIQNNDSTNYLYFNYYVYGSPEDNFAFTAPSIPADIMALNTSLLDLSKLEYSYTSYSEYDLLNGYDDYIKAYKVDQRNLYKEGLKRRWNYIYPPDKKPTKEIDDQQMIKQLKDNPYSF